MITTTIEIIKGEPIVTEVSATQPDLKAVQLEKFKIAAFKYWNTL